MPKLIKLYLKSIAYGFALSGIALALLLCQDIANLRHLIFQSDIGFIAAIMMIVMNGVVFSGVQFAIAIMGLAQDDDDPRGGLPADPVLVPIKVAVKVAGPQRP